MALSIGLGRPSFESQWLGPPPKQDDGQAQAAATSAVSSSASISLLGAATVRYEYWPPALRVDSDNYGLVTGMKPDGVVAVTVGLATLVSGTAGGVVVVIVCSEACCPTGPPTCSRSAELTS